MNLSLYRLTLAALLAGCSLPALAAEPKPGSVFRDCKQACPEMVVLPAGSFQMGTPDDELGRQDDEGPLHTVTFAKPFAMSRFQVTAAEWDAYLKASGTRIADGDDRPGRRCTASKPSYPQGPRQPAVCMNFEEVEHYVAWLSKTTGKHYRMVSEAEREYAARAGSSGPFPFAMDPGEDYQISRNANTYGPKDGFSYTSPVGSYPANAFGLYDMHGNVYEWLADCWSPNYQGAPTDGSAWTTGLAGGDCTTRQIRGNDWSEAPIFSRSGNRNTRKPEVRGDWLGLRVVREL
ncbi:MULTISPECIES: formylglycine-generating enzyme family protein [unclassified Pseudomonas]|uniref:dihydropyoverdine dehydrogenase n=1 Tax=unclassified Pseudomonas TaxID=196821 RepID=UPI002097FF60|nr:MULTISPECIES: formylglycine-generating enzyme family protein [unclassified Pseudomonas]MCO7519045.1 formylglycine-generating enzyme family protein [Pseudomonas sp. 1]MCO7539930.1 formylglycine-generating enzyme family protein [Pseudomonas sp. VA159-2]